MMQLQERDSVSTTLELINRTWLEGRPRDLAPLLHPSIVMVMPTFNGHIEGRDAFIDGFVDFCENAALHEYEQCDHRVDVTGDTAVASFTFSMVYERADQRYRSSGRDLWVFVRQEGIWLAAWRTMLDLVEQPAL
jgi:hypothetical protein